MIDEGGLVILIYNDEGVGEIGVYNLGTILKKFHKEIKYVDSTFILNEDLSPYRSLIIPGGADLAYCKKLNGQGNTKIKEFVQQGGTYLGICAGAYYGCSDIDFTGEGYSIIGERELSFFSGQAKGSLIELTNGVYYNEQSNSKSIVEITLPQNNNECFYSYYHGGPEFLGAKPEEILATYPNKKVAAVSGTYGKGYYILTSFHFEVEADTYDKYLEKELTETDRQIEDKIYNQLKEIKKSDKNTFWKNLLLHI